MISEDLLWRWLSVWADGVTACLVQSGARSQEGEGLSLWQGVTMKVDADAREAPAAPPAAPGTPTASNTESPVSSLDGLLVNTNIH